MNLLDLEQGFHGVLIEYKSGNEARTLGYWLDGFLKCAEYSELAKGWVQAFEKVGYFTYPATILLCILMVQCHLVDFFRPLHAKRFAPCY